MPIIEHVSEASEEYGWSGTRVPRDPPVPVWVDLRRVFAPQRVGLQPGTPLRVRAAGIDNSRTAPGELVAWHHTATGDRWAHVQRVELVNRNGHGRLVTELWVPEAAVSPREAGGAGR